MLCTNTSSPPNQPPMPSAISPKIENRGRKEADRVDPAQPEARCEDHEGDQIGDEMHEPARLALASVMDRKSMSPGTAARIAPTIPPPSV